MKINLFSKYIKVIHNRERFS